MTNREPRICDAVVYGKAEALRKFHLSRATDDIDALVCEYCARPKPEIAEFFVSLGADVTRRVGEMTPMENLFHSLGFDLEPFFGSYSGGERAP